LALAGMTGILRTTRALAALRESARTRLSKGINGAPSAGTTHSEQASFIDFEL